MVFTVWDLLMPGYAVPIGGAVRSLLTKSKALRRGRQKLKLIWSRTGEEALAKGQHESSVSSVMREQKRLDQVSVVLLLCF